MVVSSISNTLKSIRIVYILDWNTK